MPIQESTCSWYLVLYRPNRFTAHRAACTECSDTQRKPQIREEQINVEEGVVKLPALHKLTFWWLHNLWKRSTAMSPLERPVLLKLGASL